MSTEENMDVSSAENISDQTAESEAAAEVSILKRFMDVYFSEDPNLTNNKNNLFQIYYLRI